MVVPSKSLRAFDFVSLHFIFRDIKRYICDYNKVRIKRKVKSELALVTVAYKM